MFTLLYNDKPPSLANIFLNRTFYLYAHLFRTLKPLRDYKPISHDDVGQRIVLSYALMTASLSLLTWYKPTLMKEINTRITNTEYIMRFICKLFIGLVNKRLYQNLPVIQNDLFLPRRVKTQATNDVFSLWVA